MQIRHINSYLIHQLKFRLIIFTFVLGFFSVILYYNLSNTGSEKQYKDESDSLQTKLTQLKEYISKTDSSIKLWNDEIKPKHGDRPGLRVEEFKKLLDQLKEVYNIQELIINLLTPEQRTDIGQMKFVTVRASNLTLSFSASNDLDVYQFLMALVNQTPGYLQVKNISIIGVSEINNDIAKSLLTGGRRDIVTVKVEFVWQDMQDIVQSKTDQTNNATTPR